MGLFGGKPKQLKALGVPVVWGGVHATIMAEECLKEDYVDFVVVNEGEETSQELAQMLTGQKPADFGAVRGLAWKDAGKPVVNLERPFIQDLDRFRPRWDLIPTERYLIQSGPYQRALPIYISRGCPFRCGFCYNEVVMKRTWRQHSDEFILDQVQQTALRFQQAVAKNRGTTLQDVQANFGAGRVVGAKAALAAGMIDEVLTGTAREFIGQLIADLLSIELRRLVRFVERNHHLTVRATGIVAGHECEIEAAWNSYCMVDGPQLRWRNDHVR